MTNRLKMAAVQSILTLHERGWSQWRIAVELDVDCETDSRYVELSRVERPTACVYDQRLLERQAKGRVEAEKAEVAAFGGGAADSLPPLGFHCDLAKEPAAGADLVRPVQTKLQFADGESGAPNVPFLSQEWRREIQIFARVQGRAKIAE